MMCCLQASVQLRTSLVQITPVIIAVGLEEAEAHVSERRRGAYGGKVLDTSFGSQRHGKWAIYKTAQAARNQRRGDEWGLSVRTVATDCHKPARARYQRHDVAGDETSRTQSKYSLRRSVTTVSLAQTLPPLANSGVQRPT